MFLVVSCFFFKQKTAYEMRISDWSSDVCSSDLVSDILVRQSISSIGLGFLVKGRRDNIPPRSTFAEMVEGREGSSDVIRVVKGGEGWCSLWRPIRDAQSRPP